MDYKKMASEEAERQRKGKNKRTEYEDEDEESDFEHDRSKKRRKTPKKSGRESKKKVAKKATREPHIRCRTSPRPMCAAMHTLSNVQKECLKNMGFGAFINFKLDVIPWRLGYFVVDNFDDQSLEMKLKEGVIKVTKNTVLKILGVPLGGEPLQNIEVKEADEEIIVNWWKQFPNKDVSSNEVMKRIIMSEEADWNFKLNFVVLFANTMGQSKSRGKCDLSVLNYMTKDIVFSKIDWCEFILKCVTGCKNGWKREDHNGFFAGPITFLTLLYVDGTVCNGMKVNRDRPVMVNWNSQMLKTRERGARFEYAKLSESEHRMDSDNNEQEQPVTEQINLPICWRLADEVLKNCAAKLNLHLPDNVAKEYKCSSRENIPSPIHKRKLEGIKDKLPAVRQCQEATRNSVKVVGIHSETENKNENEIEIENETVLFDDSSMPTKDVTQTNTGLINVRGYKVKQNIATILEAIFKKHGDIAAECVFRADSLKTYFLGVVCEIVRQINNNNVSEKMEEIECQVSDAEAANINVSWLRAHLEAICKRNEAIKRSNLLSEMKTKTVLVKRAAQMDLRETSAELVVAQQRFEKAEKCVRVLHLFEKKLNDYILESKNERESRVKESIL